MWAASRSGHRSPSAALLPHCSGAVSRRREFLVHSGKSEYISGSLSQSEALRSLSTKKTEASLLAEQSSHTDIQETDVAGDVDIVVQYIDDSDVSDTFDLDEGWEAVAEDELVVVESPEEEDEEEGFDLRLDPIFSHLSMKSVQKLEKEIKKDKERQKKDMDESSLSTRSQGTPHRKLRIVGGALKGALHGRRLLSPRGRFVRPMMERVRSAIFDMLFSGNQGFGLFPETARWLDLYAGTGAVGLEALSRGCRDVHFVEMDPWVVSNVLKRNIDECGCTSNSTIRTMKVEQFLDSMIQLPQYSSGPFDFITVCPPYQQVSYPELQQQLEDSGVLHDRSIIFMEYPRQLSRQIRESIGSLKKIKDRQYGRTYLAVYGNERE